MEKVLKDGKLYSLIEFRDRIYEDLDLSKSDLTTLLCAMLIASIGLNMNTIPAIIGAMLISPLMTPILGVGFALAILDTKLLKKSFKILFIQVAVSLLASTLYFLLSPISYASTEIIARTSPTIWDVVIAFVGGLAGIIGARKKLITLFLVLLLQQLLCTRLYCRLFYCHRKSRVYGRGVILVSPLTVVLL